MSRQRDAGMRYVTVRPGKTGFRFFWQRKGYPLTRLPDDEIARHKRAKELNDWADTTPPQRTSPPDDFATVAGIIADYRLHHSFVSLAPNTKRYYERWLDDIRQTSLHDGGSGEGDGGGKVVTDQAETIIAKMARELRRRIPGIYGDAPEELARACWAVIERHCAAAGKAAEAAGPAEPTGDQARRAAVLRLAAEWHAARSAAIATPNFWPTLADAEAALSRAAAELAAVAEGAKT
jgi:hypothetical protein